MGATPKLPGFGIDGLIARFKQIDYRLNLMTEKVNHALDNTGMSVPGPGVTQVDGNLSIAGLGRILLATGGSIELDDKSGRQVMYVGGFTTNGFGMTLTRLNGIQALVFSDNDPVNETTQRIALQDSNGTSLFAEDRNGAGAGWPLAPIVFEDLTWANWSNNTTSSFVAVQQATHYKSSPQIYFTGQAICDGTATGEVRLMCNGTQIGTTASIANLTMTGVGFGTPAALPGNIGDPLTLTLEARVTGGAGKTYAHAITAMAWPS